MNLTQKLVARLLGQGTIDAISRYENGHRLPNLEVALKLEIIYGAPVRSLFGELYHQLLEEVQKKVRTSPILYSGLDSIGNPDFCSFADSLSSAQLSEKQFDKIRAHAKYMTEKFSERYGEYRRENSNHEQINDGE